MFKIFKKVTCDNCKNKFRRNKIINYVGVNICSEKCMCEYFKNITTDELLELHKKDRKNNA